MPQAAQRQGDQQQQGPGPPRSRLSAPQTGHAFSEGGWDLRDAIVIIVSHSGGTFGPLAVANLLQASTQDIFVVTSEWETAFSSGDQQSDRITISGPQRQELCSRGRDITTIAPTISSSRCRQLMQGDIKDFSWCVSYFR